MSNCMVKYAEYQQFSSVREMNQHLKQIKNKFRHQLTDTALEVLNYLSRYSLNVVGVSYRKVSKIAEDLGRSARTIQYATKQLASFGIIEKKATIREGKKKGYGANVYIIKADCTSVCTSEFAYRPEAETPAVSRAEAPNSGTESFNSFNHPSKPKDINFESARANYSPVDNSSVSEPVDNTKPKIDSRLYDDIPSMIKTSLGRLGNNKFANALWKKVIDAYVHSPLYKRFDRHKLQLVLDMSSTMALYAHIQRVVHDYLANDVYESVEGYMYIATRTFFEDWEEEIRAEERREYWRNLKEEEMTEEQKLMRDMWDSFRESEPVEELISPYGYCPVFGY